MFNGGSFGFMMNHMPVLVFLWAVVVFALEAVFLQGMGPGVGSSFGLMHYRAFSMLFT